jgi:hypothetical protein
MFYSLLGRLTWFVALRLLRKRYGRLMLPKPLIAGALLVAALGVLLGLRRSDSSIG